MMGEKMTPSRCKHPPKSENQNAKGKMSNESRKMKYELAIYKNIFHL
jgi:hypothetical protein